VNLLAWTLVALLIGWMTRVLAPSFEPGGFVATLLVAVIGGIVGGWLYDLCASQGGWDARSLLTAVLGSLVLLRLWRRSTGARAICI
jgi:uncharacterized membrane protein YeaQ/YmgE (transglycosylase-associated protein family)